MLSFLPLDRWRNWGRETRSSAQSPTVGLASLLPTLAFCLLLGSNGNRCWVAMDTDAGLGAGKTDRRGVLFLNTSGFSTVTLELRTMLKTVQQINWADARSTSAGPKHRAWHCNGDRNHCLVPARTLSYKYINIYSNIQYQFQVYVQPIKFWKIRFLYDRSTYISKLLQDPWYKTCWIIFRAFHGSHWKRGWGRMMNI